MDNYVWFYYKSMMEAANFPGWELFILLNSCFWVSVIFRLHRIENKQDTNRSAK
jgi:hypothetical protein